MEAVPVKFVARGYGETFRRDAWWVEPLVVFLVLGGFVVYATWAAFQNAHYTFGRISRRSISPVIFGEGEHAWFGPKPGWWPALLPFSPALIILPFPASSASPATTTAAPTTRRSGPTRSRARWASRAARTTAASAGSRWCCRTCTATSPTSPVLFLFMLSYDVWLALWFRAAGGGKEFGIGLGTDRPGGERGAADVVHAGLSLDRHLVGGRKDEVSKSASARPATTARAR
jgi:hypothetical protein